MSEPSVARRRWFQFTLRGALLAIAIIATGAAWVGHQRKLSQREAVVTEQLRAQGWYVSFVGPFLRRSEYGLDVKSDAAPAWWRLRLSELCGPRIRLARYDGSGPAIVTPGFKLRYLDDADFSKRKPCDLTLLAGLGMLDEILVQFASIRDPAPLEKVPALARLSIACTGVSDLAPLAGLTQLETLNLSHSRVSDLAPLAKLTRLKRLLIHNSPLVRDITPIAGLTKLETLNLSDTRVVDVTPLAGLENLTSLSVEHTPVSDLSPLTSLKSLRSLSIRRAQVEEREARRVRSLLPACKISSDYRLPQPKDAVSP